MSDSKNNINHSKENKDEQNKKSGFQERVNQRGEEASLVRKIVATVLIILTIVIVVGGLSGYTYIKSALEPVDPSDNTQKSIEIPLGSSSSQIAKILEENNIINNARVYQFYIKFNNVGQFQAGEYDLSPSMTLAEITDSLQEGRVFKEPVIRVTIPEGKTMEQIASLYAEKANVDKEEFLEKVEDEEFIQELINTYPTILSEDILNTDIKTPLEGYLFAATYQFYEEEPSIETIVYAMLDKTEDVMASYLGRLNEMEDWTVHEVITMASLIENEARSTEHRRKVAGVFFNRLNADMMLQTDPTVAYARGEHLERTLYEHLDVDSPYNTYQVIGLPVGPISNFAENSLEAVFEPEESENMYFLYADGEIYYSQTYEEHQQNIEQYQD